MINKINTNIERIISKIDNDFNPDNSDWIPRVGAWAIDAMQMLKVLRIERKRFNIKVHDRIGYSECAFDVSGLKVYDKNGCSIIESHRVNKSCNCPSTGKQTETDTLSMEMTPNTINVIHNDNNDNASKHVIVETVNAKNFPDRYNVKDYQNTQYVERTYTIIDDNKIELNFDTDCIIIEYDSIKTCKSDKYNCEMPVIPNNGLLIEAICLFCMYKMLLRGYKHPIFNLGASQYGTNPYYMWTTLMEKAKRSVIIDEQGETINDKNAWRTSFIDFTFNPFD